jgi:transposase
VDTIFPHCAGLDVHKKTVVACVRHFEPDASVRAEVRTYGTTTAELIALADWLLAEGVSHVAMESTGVYWKPVYHVLEGQFELLLVNAQHIKKVPGHKTDVKDAEWIAQLMQHGLLRASFVPPPPVRDLRDLTRARSQLVAERARFAQRIHKVLEDANLKLASVATDVLGASGKTMLRAIIDGVENPAYLAEFAKGRLREKKAELASALHGFVRDHHRFLLRSLLEQIEQFERWIAEYDARIEQVMLPFAEAAARLKTIPGVGRRAAEVILAEIGPDMAKFPTAGHLASWAGMCPGKQESAGKQRSGKTTKGSQWLRTTLVQVAWAASHTKQTILSQTYRRWAKRLGRKKALVALGHKILVLIYQLIQDQTVYRERYRPPEAA